MPPFDRDAALKSAEKALRLGRIEAAIAEYVRIVEAQPRDWNSANALGDLYVRSKQLDQGIAQYTRIADHLASEGSYPKAAALYKKILKFKPDEEYALLQSADVAAKQGLLPDAKAALRTVADRRREHGDKKGAAEITIRIGTLDPDDFEARLGAARAALEIGDETTALREFREVALGFEKQGDTPAALAALRSAYDLDNENTDVRGRLLDGYLKTGKLDEARDIASGTVELKRVAGALEAAGRADYVLEVLAEVAKLDPKDRKVRADLALAYVARQDWDRARSYLDAETAGRSARLWLTLAEIELASGHPAEGRAAVARALTLDEALRPAAVDLGCRLAAKSPDAGYPALDAVAEVALTNHDFAGAATALQEFVAQVPGHVIALMRLVEICVDGGLETTMQATQAQLADGYLKVGRALEARIISEDLIAREPWNTENIDRFRRALLMLGEKDPDGIIAERLSGDSPFLATDKLDLNEGVFFDDAAPKAQPAARLVEPALQIDEDILIDLDTELVDDDSLETPSPEADAAAPPAQAAVAEPESLEEVFEQMRTEVNSGSAEEAAMEQYGLAMTYRELGMVDDAMQALELAAQSPRQRFEAASMLAHMHLEQDKVQGAIDWFERATESPAPTAAAGRALLYEFAETLEKAGQHARALAVFVELDAEAGGYRDVAYRILRLSKLQSKR